MSNNGDRKKTKNLEVQQKSEFLGTQRRKNAMSTVMQICREYCNPEINYNELLNLLCYRTGLTKRKLEEDYIEVLIGIKFLQHNKFNIELGESEKDV